MDPRRAHRKYLFYTLVSQIIIDNHALGPNRRRAVLTSPDSRLRMGVHISELPPEILCEVIEHLVIDGIWALRHALFVCRRWHSTIISNQKAWSTIDIGKAYVQYFQFRQKGESLQFLKAALKYSGTSPIQITIDWRYHLPLYWDPDSDVPLSCRMPLGSDVMALAAENGSHLRRCRTLKVVYDPTTTSAFLMEYATYLVNLECISISGYNGSSSTLARILRSPRLRVVKIIRSDWDSLNGALGRGSQATKLCIERNEPWKPRHAECLAVFTFLHTLVISRNAREDVWSLGKHTALPRVPLWNLSILRLRGPVHRHLLDSLHIPSLTSLYITDDDWARNALGYIPITTWDSNIRHLHLDLVEDGWGPDLLRVIKKSELRTITLTRSMSGDHAVLCIPNSITVNTEETALP